MDFENYYTLLGVSRKATPDGIKKAYHERIKALHPATGIRQPGPEEQQAGQMTRVLNQAYYILIDKKRRKNYDELLYYTENKSCAANVNEQTFWKKLDKAAPALQGILDQVKDLYYLFTDTLQGKYKVHPLTIGLVGGGLLYLLMPFDLLPDILPFLGFMDDVTVLTTIMTTIRAELADYREWRLKQTD